MEQKIKSGKQILDEFFEEIKNEENVDEATVSGIVGLYQNGKLTDGNLTNALSGLREGKKDGKSK